MSELFRWFMSAVAAAMAMILAFSLAMIVYRLISVVYSGGGSPLTMFATGVVIGVFCALTYVIKGGLD